MKHSLLRTLNLITIALFLLLSACTNKPESKSVQFKKTVISSSFISEGVAVGDVNKDGKPDIIAGPKWFEAPDFQAHQIYEQKDLDSASEYSNSFLNFALDVNLDEWIDVIVVGLPGEPAVWYENPRNAEGNWKQHAVNDSVRIGNESPHFVDMDNDGRGDILCADPDAKQIVWLRSPHKSSETWERHTISEREASGTGKYSHGLGYDDVNGDGKKDVLIKEGWWENPNDSEKQTWAFHPADLGEDCAHMYPLDLNGDGLTDVLSSSAHRYGIWWHEQRDSAGTPVWQHHLIYDKVSQTHSLTMADLNGDGHPDLVTGKRLFAHNDTDVDPGAREPSMLIWLEYHPSASPTWTVHEIDSASGVGLNIAITDMNNDGKPDIVVSNKKGVYYFENGF